VTATNRRHDLAAALDAGAAAGLVRARTGEES